MTAQQEIDGGRIPPRMLAYVMLSSALPVRYDGRLSHGGQEALSRARGARKRSQVPVFDPKVWLIGWRL